MTDVTDPTQRQIEKLELDVQLRDARINALRRERMEQLFPRITELEEQVVALTTERDKLLQQRSVLVIAMQQFAANSHGVIVQLEAALGLVEEAP